MTAPVPGKFEHDGLKKPPTTWK